MDEVDKLIEWINDTIDVITPNTIYRWMTNVQEDFTLNLKLMPMHVKHIQHYNLLIHKNNLLIGLVRFDNECNLIETVINKTGLDINPYLSGYGISEESQMKVKKENLFIELKIAPDTKLTMQEKFKLLEDRINSEEFKAPKKQTFKDTIPVAQLTLDRGYVKVWPTHRECANHLGIGPDKLIKIMKLNKSYKGHLYEFVQQM